VSTVDDHIVVSTGRATTLQVLTNDTDPYGHPLVVTAASPTGHGSIGVAAGGTALTYTPDPGFTGTDATTYTVTSSAGAVGHAHVTIEVGTSVAVVLNASPRIIAVRRYVLTGSVTLERSGQVRVSVRARRGATWGPSTAVTVGGDGSFGWPYAAKRPESVVWQATAVWDDGAVAVSDTVTTVALAAVDVSVSGPLRLLDVPYSYRSGCPIAPNRLRRMQITYWNYAGTLSRGSLVVGSWAVVDLRTVFTAAFAGKFRIAKMIPVDAYYNRGHRTPTQSDIAQMAAGNTSAFNCRSVTGNKYRMSQHSYGDAIDINCFQNPYVTTHAVYPSAAKWRYVTHRASFLRDPGVITRRTAMAVAMARRHWQWGARWAHPDYQHFSRNGG
jgi:hypothetical protein